MTPILIVFHLATYSQGEYCTKLLNENDYLTSMEEVILCLTETGNWESALAKNEERRGWLNRVGSSSNDATIDDQHDFYMSQLWRISHHETSVKCLIALDNFELAREVISSAMDEYDKLTIPFQQNTRLYEKLSVIGAVKQYYYPEDDDLELEVLWNKDFSSNDSMRRATYEIAVDKLHFSESWDEFDLIYPAVNMNGPMVYAERIAKPFFKEISATYYAKCYISECPDVECYYEAIDFLEELDVEEISDPTEIHLILGILNFLCENQTLSCRKIKKACEMDGERLNSLWSIVDSMAETEFRGNRLCTCKDF